MSTLEQIRPLTEADSQNVCGWLEEWLLEHIGGWVKYYGLSWNDDQIAAHILKHSLVEREWNEILNASNDKNCLVRVSEIGTEAIGIIYAEFVDDRYLRLPVGVISWLYVVPLWRGARKATGLIAQAQAWHAERGAIAAEAFVTIGNTSAMRSYAKAGFETVDARLVASLRNL